MLKQMVLEANALLITPTLAAIALFVGLYNIGNPFLFALGLSVFSFFALIYSKRQRYS